MVGQMRWLLWPSTIRAAYLLGGAGEEQLNRQAAARLAANSLGFMVTVQRYHECTRRATGRSDKRRDSVMPESRPRDGRHDSWGRASRRAMIGISRAGGSRFTKTSRSSFWPPSRLLSADLSRKWPEGWRHRQHSLGPRQKIWLGRCHLQTNRCRSNRNRHIPEGGIREGVSLSCD